VGWKEDNKGLGPWNFAKQKDQPFYNEGNLISSYVTPVWDIDHPGAVITPTHTPCGYWASVPGEYLAGEWGYVLGKWTLLDDDAEGEYLGGAYLGGYTGVICPPGLAMVWDYAVSAETVVRDDSALVAFDCNEDPSGAPYTWEITGTGFTLNAETTIDYQNLVFADNTACGTASITVTDSCGHSTDGYVRCTTGMWSWPPTLGCADGMTGKAPSGYSDHNQVLTMTKTEGKYAQTDILHSSVGGSCFNLVCADYCNQEIIGEDDCIGCTECLDIANFCPQIDFEGSPMIQCGDWCCGTSGCELVDGGYCYCEQKNSYREWIC